MYANFMAEFNAYKSIDDAMRLYYMMTLNYIEMITNVCTNVVCN